MTLPVSEAHDALILAAGVGRRLLGQNGTPKALLEFGGRTLLARHVAELRRGGVARIMVVAGHEAARLEAEARAVDPAVEVVVNPSFRRGSVVSLACGRALLEGGRPVVLMDADVLHGPAVLARLLGSRHRDCFLLDRDIEPGDEPVKLCLAEGAIVDFAKIPDRPHDSHGESVGFFRFGSDTARELAARACRLAHADPDAEYEVALRDMVLAGPPDRFGFEDVTGLPWTEIDFPEDVVRARHLAARLGDPETASIGKTA